MAGHSEAVNWIYEIIKEDRPMTEFLIRQLHSLILKKSYQVCALTPEGKPTQKTVKVGEYKSIPNHVGTRTGEIFRFASPEETPALRKAVFLCWTHLEKLSMCSSYRIKSLLILSKNGLRQRPGISSTR